MQGSTAFETMQEPFDLMLTDVVMPGMTARHSPTR